jgi:small subunit ribosomal protein S15
MPLHFSKQMTACFPESTSVEAAYPARFLRVLFYLSTKSRKEKTRSITPRMALAIEVKRQIFSTNQRHKTDTGSSEVQIALLSRRISMLTEHFKTHKKDHGSRKGLLTLVAKRRRLLTYLRNTDPERYKAVLQRLGIRR